MNIILISDSLVFKEEPLIVMLDLLAHNKKIELANKDIKFISQNKDKRSISRVNKVRLRNIFKNALKNKKLVNIGRGFEENDLGDVLNTKKVNTMLASYVNKKDILVVLITEALDIFIEPIIAQLGVDTVIAESMLVANNVFTGEYNFILDEDFLLQFVQGLKRENNKLITIGDKVKDSYLLSLADEVIEI